MTRTTGFHDPLRTSFAIKNEGHRAVVFQRHPHERAESAAFNLDPVGVEPGDHALIKRSCQIRRSGLIEPGPTPFFRFT